MEIIALIRKLHCRKHYFHNLVIDRNSTFNLWKMIGKKFDGHYAKAHTVSVAFLYDLDKRSLKMGVKNFL